MLVSGFKPKKMSSRRNQIMNVSLDMMRQLGYQSTSMREIAAALNIEAASLYNHITGKEEILRVTCFGLGNQLLLAMNEVNDIYFNAAEKLRMLVKNHIHILTTDLNAGWVFIHEWRNLSEKNRLEFIALRDKYEAGIIEILQQGKDEGVFNEVNNKFAALTLLSSLNWVVEWYKPQGDMSPEEVAEKLTDFILTGLKKD
jgi:AcrR family transcriptional regulator